MAITRAKKAERVEQYQKHLQESQGLILTDYRGLRVAEIEELRRSLRGAGATYHVVKNRLLLMALQQMGLTMPREWLEGPVAVAFCHGEVPAAAKVVQEFAKGHEKFSVKGGLLGKTPITAAQVNALATLPPREVLLARVLGALHAPASQVAGVVASGIRQVLNVLQAYVEKLEGKTAPQTA
ncbi:MAG: 50S ribosomal protein L10 [Anaerolineae bacterium]|nr:50S ribosomal protein L10 [Anaerolineae bacterium]MDW8069377.1 50S ribosomal protein L10 [Anaerolineae bacterium]